MTDYTFHYGNSTITVHESIFVDHGQIVQFNDGNTLYQCVKFPHFYKGTWCDPLEELKSYWTYCFERINKDIEKHRDAIMEVKPYIPKLLKIDPSVWDIPDNVMSDLERAVKMLCK